MAKELIHHYLRQGLLPRSAARARYSAQHVRLLRQIRTLREDHNLPLEVIRRLFEMFEFAPGQIESLTLTESLCKRVTRFASTGDLLSHDTLSDDELAAAAGVTAERLQEYVQARMVAPLAAEGEQRFSVYDAAVVAQCEHGLELGVPFDSFRTIASYVRIAFDLEHAVFYGVISPLDSAPDSVLSNVFVRREVATGFVQNLMHAMTQRRIRDLLEQTQPARDATIDKLVYRPSAAFVERHGIEARIDAVREELHGSTNDRRLWLEIGELLVHAGRYDDAVFFIEESLERWPDDTALRSAFGRALIVAGNDERGCAELVASSCPRATVMGALSLYRTASADKRAESLLRGGARILEAADLALSQSTLPEVTAFCGWLLASLPPIYGTTQRGLTLLRDTVTRIERGDPVDAGMPGARERNLINAAYLLFDCLARDSRADTKELERLVSLICRFDPSSAFAESVFLRRSAS